EAALRADELRRIRLDRGRIVELRRNGARLAAEERVPGHRLPRLELVPGQLLHACRDVAYAAEVEVGLDAVQRAQRERDLAEVRVTGPLPHAVDGSVHPACACTDGGDRRRGGEPEVVVAVEMNRNVPDELDRPTDEIGYGFGRRDAERVHDDDLLRARLDRR